MDLLKTATEWGKAEMFSSVFFILFGTLFLLASAGFWQLGKTDVAKAFVYPTMVAGLLLLAIGIGLYFTNQSRVAQFPLDYNTDATAFIQAEITRTEKTIAEYQTVVFKAIPLIIVAAALMVVFMEKPIWRASGITIIAMMAVILLVDSNANARIEAYHQQLILEQKTE